MAIAGDTLVRQSLLGTDATYRIVDAGLEIVTAEVIDAPGLTAGMRVSFVADAVRAMSRVGVDEQRRHASLGPVTV
jgi:hypothetical protein